MYHRPTRTKQKRLPVSLVGMGCPRVLGKRRRQIYQSGTNQNPLRTSKQDSCIDDLHRERAATRQGPSAFSRAYLSLPREFTLSVALTVEEYRPRDAVSQSFTLSLALRSSKGTRAANTRPSSQPQAKLPRQPERRRQRVKTDPRKLLVGDTKNTYKKADKGRSEDEKTGLEARVSEVGRLEGVVEDRRVTVGRIKGLHARFSYDSLREKESEGWLVNCKSSGAGSLLNVHVGVRNCKSVLVSEMSWQREIERVDLVGGWVIRGGFVGRAEATTSKSDFRSTCIDFAGCSAYTFAGHYADEFGPSGSVCARISPMQSGPLTGAPNPPPSTLLCPTNKPHEIYICMHALGHIDTPRSKLERGLLWDSRYNQDSFFSQSSAPFQSRLQTVQRGIMIGTATAKVPLQEKPEWVVDVMYLATIYRHFTAAADIAAAASTTVTLAENQDVSVMLTPERLREIEFVHTAT
ncbi:hypothetical protein KQX54_008925 [Cotesia glomerata]|uniref:Uncharacterized protein n=1 Tax=Cotesia glomerata TaxID=32391 RepID=A0AAV7IIJ6_COTGL|nr:hypothetical protein KQX54_008925 [Cotesia glomerata]